MRQEIMLLSYKQIITIHRFSHYEAKFLLWEIDRERFLTTTSALITFLLPQILGFFIYEWIQVGTNL